MSKLSRTSEAYQVLKEQILDGVYAPNQKLGIDHIGKSMSVSPGAIREALARLTSDALVVAQPQRGFVVAPISIEDLRDLTAVRIEVEVQCLERSLKLGDLNWESRVVAAHHRLENLPLIGASGGQNTAKPSPEWIEAHVEFHDALLSACDSVWWFRLRDQLFNQADRYRRLMISTAKTNRDVTTEHREIKEACLKRDVKLAVKLLTQHMEKTATLLIDSSAELTKKQDSA